MAVKYTGGFKVFTFKQLNTNSVPPEHFFFWNTTAGQILEADEETSVNTSVSATDTESLSIIYTLANATTMPSGVVLQSNGSIIGTLPVVNATTNYDFDIMATNGQTNIFRTFSINVLNVPVAPVWTTPSGQIYSGNENTTVTANVVATVTNGLPITYSLTNSTTLPGGVSLSNTGLITGTLPSVSNTTSYNFTIRAETTDAFTDRDFSIQSVLVPIMPVWSTPAGSFYSDNENVAFSKNMVATITDNSAITYALVNSTTLPGGVSMLSNGLVYGILPEVSNTTAYNFDVRATAAEGSADRSFTITSVNVITDPNYNTIWMMSHFDNGVANASTYFDHGPLHMSLAGDPSNGPFISNAAAKFGGSSLYYPTGSSVFAIPYDAGTDFTANAFTVEMWFNVSANATTSRSLFNRPRDTPSNATHQFNLTTHTDGRLRFYYGSTSITGTTVIQANTWYHVAVTRNGANTALYLNGVQEVTGASFAMPGTPQALFIGGNASAARHLGYMDDIRISKSVRYTGTFTPPEAPFPNS